MPTHAGLRRRVGGLAGVAAERDRASDMFTMRPHFARSIPRRARPRAEERAPEVRRPSSRSYVSMGYFSSSPSW